MTRKSGSRGGGADWEANPNAYANTIGPLAAGVGQYIVLAGNVPAAALGPAQSFPGKLHVSEVEIDVEVFNPGLAGVAAYTFAVGCHYSRYSSAAGGGAPQWSVQSPFTSQDANEPWYYLDRRVETFPSNALCTTPWRCTFKKRVRVNRTVGQGESIGVIVANSAGSPSTLTFLLYCRAAITKMW